MPTKASSGFYLKVGPASVYVNYANITSAFIVMKDFEEEKLNWMQATRQLRPENLEVMADERLEEADKKSEQTKSLFGRH